MDKLYDLIILGAGPAGLAAGLYAGRARLDTLILEKGQPGGQIAITSEIENYPGGVEGDTGPALVARMAAQAERAGAARIYGDVSSVALDGPVKTVTCADGKVYQARTVIAATGAFPRPMGVPRERELSGRGISYCATCDANFFEDFEVYVVGGGDAAVEEALYLTKFARKVTIIHRRDELRAARFIQEQAFANPKIAFLWDTVVVELQGEELLSGMTLQNVKTGERTQITPDEDDGIFGLFVFIGFTPNSALFEGALAMEGGYLVTNERMHTNVSGVFAAGDVRAKSLRQVITAAADGAIAAIEAEHYINEVKAHEATG